jgi:hypothetical protein
MTDQLVEVEGKKYQLKEPTISSWSKIMMLKNILNEEDMYIKMIEEVTGLPKDKILNADASTIKSIGDKISKHLNQDSKELYSKIEHNGQKYNLIDVNKISFGQFVDIDTFLSKDESYRISNLNELAAYLYVENGIEYGQSDFKKRIEDMKDLPIKYVEGSLFFLSNLGRGLQELSHLYFQSKVMWAIMRIKITSAIITDGIAQLVSLPKTRFGKLTMSLLYPLWLVLTIFLMLLISITKKIKEIINYKQ